MIRVIKLIISDWKQYTVTHKKVNVLLFLIIFFRNPGMHFSLVYRIERYLLCESPVIFKVLGALLYPFYFIYTYYILDIDIPPRVQIGKGLYIHNKGIIVADRVKIGDNVRLTGPLTIGAKGIGENPDGIPTLKNNVIIFAGARIIGDITLGDFVRVGANAVVVKDVPSYCIVGGVPAKILKKINP